MFSYGDFKANLLIIAIVFYDRGARICAFFSRRNRR